MKLSNEDLLKLLNESKEVVAETKISPVAKFKDFYNIIPGDDKVLSKYLFILFKNYIKSSINSNRFEKELSIHIKFKDDYFFVNLEESNFKNLIVPMQSEPLQNEHISIVTNFFEDYAVGPGKDIVVESETLYELLGVYLKRDNKRNVIKFEVFEEIASELLNPVVSSKGLVFKLDKGLFEHFTKEEIEDAKNGKKENQQKKPRKIPKSKTGT